MVDTNPGVLGLDIRLQVLWRPPVRPRKPDRTVDRSANDEFQIIDDERPADSNQKGLFPLIELHRYKPVEL